MKYWPAFFIICFVLVMVWLLSPESDEKRRKRWHRACLKRGGHKLFADNDPTWCERCHALDPEDGMPVRRTP